MIHSYIHTFFVEQYRAPAILENMNFILDIRKKTDRIHALVVSVSSIAVTTILTCVMLIYLYFYYLLHILLTSMSIYPKRGRQRLKVILKSVYTFSKLCLASYVKIEKTILLADRPIFSGPFSLSRLSSHAMYTDL